MNQYLLLLHETPADTADLSPAAMQELVADYVAWSRRLAEAGQLVGGEKLAEEGGRRLQLQGGVPLASDAPYAEAQDLVGGYFVIRADSAAQAEAVAATCPHLRGRQWIEIRRIEAL